MQTILLATLLCQLPGQQPGERELAVFPAKKSSGILVGTRISVASSTRAVIVPCTQY